MADNVTTPTAPTSVAGGLKFEDYQKRIQEAAAKTRKVEGGTVPKDVYQLATEAPEGPGKVQGMAALAQYSQEAGEMQERAEKAATGLEMVGEQTGRYLGGLETIQAGIRGQVESSQDSWGAAAEKADEYVQAARSRVGEVLNKLDETFEQFGKDRDFAKAHAMQASVQAVMGSMKNEERNIVENYGTTSKEYAQFQASKQTALATVQSNLHASYEQLAEAQQNTYLNVMSDAYTKSNMYVGFQEQQHVEMLKYKDASKNAYNLQVAQFEVGIEQMKMVRMENLANWMIETPSFSMDMTPLVTTLVDIAQTRAAAEQAYDLANPSQAKPHVSPKSHLMTGGYNRAQDRIRQEELAKKSKFMSAY